MAIETKFNVGDKVHYLDGYNNIHFGAITRIETLQDSDELHIAYTIDNKKRHEYEVFETKDEIIVYWVEKQNI